MATLEIREVWSKISGIEKDCQDALLGRLVRVPDYPARDVKVVPIKSLPPKPGLASQEGRARLMHDLASIELQAMELGLRTLIDFPAAPEWFKQELVDVVLEEARHLTMCLHALDSLGFAWGKWPVHLGLWQAVAREDTLLERILIVNRYLEGSGLDAGETLLRRLSGVEQGLALAAVETITEEELGHVQKGSDWFRRICRMKNLDPDHEFESGVKRLWYRLPRRMEPIDPVLRRRAGFSEAEIETLRNFQSRWKSAAQVETLRLN